MAGDHATRAPAKAVVFDIGNVLITWAPERFYDRRIGVARRKALFAATGIKAVNLEIDRGGDFLGLVRAAAARHPAYHDEIMLWHDCWGDMIGPEIAGSVTLMARLQRRGVPVFALSNFGLGPFGLARARYAFLDRFDRCYLSGALGLVKPDAEIYAALEDDSGLNGADLFFTDDRDENIDAAAKRGWHTHLFRGARALGQALVDQGVLAPADLAGVD